MRCDLVSAELRSKAVLSLFGCNYELLFGPILFELASAMIVEDLELLGFAYMNEHGEEVKPLPDLATWNWSMFQTENGAFFMQPNESRYLLMSPNGWTGELSARAVGLVLCLNLYSLSACADRNSDFGKISHQMFCKLQQFAWKDAEAAKIAAAVD